MTAQKPGTNEKPESDDAAALQPLAQRPVFTEGEEVLALWTGSQDIDVPLRPLCDGLGVQLNGQIARIRRDDVMAEGLRLRRVQTEGEPQTMQALHLESIPLWLAGLEPSHVREEVRLRLRLFKRWVRQRVWEAFAHETGIVTTGDAPRPSVPVNPDILTLEQIERIALAIATMALQQRAFEQQVDTRLSTLDTHMAALTEGQDTIAGRLDQAAAVVGCLLKRVNSVEALMAPGQVISALVKAIAAELAERDTDSARNGRNPYQAVFGEVMAWLREYRQTVDPTEPA